MKKILACAVCLLSMAVANSAFAAYALGPKDLAGTTSATNPQLTLQLSANVLMDYSSTATTGLYYTMGTYHNKGSRTFSSTSNDAKIVYQDATGVTMLTLPTTSASSAPGSWLSL
jgi:hypothetical protein